MIDIRLIARFAWVGYLGGMALLVLVLLHGNVGKGAQRWIDLGPIQLQPSELMKIMLVLGAGVLVPPGDRGRRSAIRCSSSRRRWRCWCRSALILKQPNLGTALITGMVGAAVFLAAGMRWWKFAIGFAAIGGGGADRL